MLFGYGNAHNLSGSGWKTESEIGNVEFPVRADRHARGKGQAGRYDFFRTGRRHPQDAPNEWRWKTRGGAGLQDIHPVPTIEDYTQDSRKAGRVDFNISARGDLVNVRAADCDRERTQITDIKVAVIRDGSRHDMALARRNVYHPPDIA